MNGEYHHGSNTIAVEEAALSPKGASSPSSCNASHRASEAAEVDAFWKAARRSSLGRRLEKRSERPSLAKDSGAATSRVADGLKRLSLATAELGDIFGELKQAQGGEQTAASSKVESSLAQAGHASQEASSCHIRHGSGDGFLEQADSANPNDAWKTLREIFKKLGNTIGDVFSDSDICSGDDGRLERADANFEQQQSPLSERPVVDCGASPETSSVNGWQRVRDAFKEFGGAMGEGLIASKRGIADGSSELAVPAAFYTSDRSDFLKNRVQRRRSAGGMTESTMPQTPSGSEHPATPDASCSASPALSQIGSGLHARALPNGSLEDLDCSPVKCKNGQHLGANNEAHHAFCNGMADSEKIGDSNSKRSGSIIGGSADAWRSSAVVAAGRSPYGFELLARRLWREMGLHVDDAEGQMLVECLCDTEGPWEPLERPLPLSQVVRCAGALWEAELQLPQSQDSVPNSGCLQT